MELLAIQGWDVGGLHFEYPKATFGSLQKIAGNGICVPVLGAVMCGLLAFVVPNDHGEHLLAPSGISFALGGVGFAPAGVAPAAAAEASASGSSSDSYDSESEASASGSSSDSYDSESSSGSCSQGPAAAAEASAPEASSDPYESESNSDSWLD